MLRLTGRPDITLDVYRGRKTTQQQQQHQFETPEKGMKKLRTYKLIKKNFEIEPYVEILQDKKLRRSLSSFRISTHRLRIERGRYCGGKT